MHRTAREKITEHDAIGHMLAERNTHRRDLGSQLDVAFDVVRMSGLFDPIRMQIADRLTDILGLRHGPLLVSIEHELALGTGELAEQGGAANIAARVWGADLQLQRAKTVLERVFGIFPKPRIV